MGRKGSDYLSIFVGVLITLTTKRHHEIPGVGIWLCRIIIKLYVQSGYSELLPVAVIQMSYRGYNESVIS